MRQRAAAGGVLKRDFNVVGLSSGQQNADAFRKNQKAFRNSARLHLILAKKWKAPDAQPKWEAHGNFPLTLIEFKKLHHSRKLSIPSGASIVLTW